MKLERIGVFATILLSNQSVMAQGSLGDWADLVSFRPDVTIQSSVLARSAGESPLWRFQRIEDGCGQINLDYFPIKITKFPIVSGQQVDAVSFINYVRLHLDQFLDHTRATVSPMTPADASKWSSSAPLGSVLSFDLKIKGVGFEGGSVVVTKFSNNAWRFSTALTGKDWGHPVSGNREFGYEPSGNGVIFYTRGVDRPNWALADYWVGQKLFMFINNMLSTWGVTSSPVLPVLFSEGDAIWTNFQISLAEFVNSNGGSASVLTPTKMRPAWDSAEVNAIYKPVNLWVDSYGFQPLPVPSTADLLPVAIGPQQQVVLVSVKPPTQSWVWEDDSGVAIPEANQFKRLQYSGQPLTATAIGPAGEIVGFIGERYSGTELPIIVFPDGKISEFPISGSKDATFESITADGSIGGTVEFETQGTSGSFVSRRGFVWHYKNSDQVINMPDVQFVGSAGHGDTEVFSVANNGWAAGTFDDGSHIVAAEWHNGVLQTNLSSDNGIAWSVNSHGGLAGQQDRSGGVEGFRVIGGTFSAMPTMGGHLGFATAINDNDEVVGHVNNIDGKDHAVIWSSLGLRLLNDIVAVPLGVELAQATALSNSGLIGVKYNSPSGPGVGVVYRFDFWSKSLSQIFPYLCK